MLRSPQRFVLSAVACALAMAVALTVWSGVTDSSEAQSDSMHNCPPAGKWSIAVWEGQSGTAAADALAACGADAVAAAYSLDPQTGGWFRWFAGKADVSNLAPLNDKQGVLALGRAPTATVTPVATATMLPTATATTVPVQGEPELGTWRGTTSQGKPLEFDVVGGSRTIGRIKFEVEGTFSGGTCEGKTEISGGSVAAIVDNAFSYSSASVGISISGVFDSTKTASGDLDYHSSPYDPDLGCDSGPLTWTASWEAIGSAGAEPRAVAGPAGQVHNCPPAGKWSIAVWEGQGGTAAVDALAACGAGTVAAAYSLDPQTGAWSRWFAGKADVSNLPSLNDMQGVLALGSATGPVATPTATATATATPTPNLAPISLTFTSTRPPGSFTGTPFPDAKVYFFIVSGFDLDALRLQLSVGLSGPSGPVADDFHLWQWVQGAPSAIALFLFPVLPAGDYTVSIALPDGRTATAAFTHVLE